MIWEAMVVVKENNGQLSTKFDYFQKKIDAEIYINSMRMRYGGLLGSAIVLNEKSVKNHLLHGLPTKELSLFVAGSKIGKTVL